MTARRRGSVVIDLMSDESCQDDSDLIIPPLHTTPKTIPKLPAPVSPEAAHFLSELSNYIPIGSLVLNGVIDAEPNWQEVQVSHLVTLTESGLFEQNALDLGKLLARQRIRAFVSIPSRAVLRIYVLPSDVGHRFFQQDRGLDTHLFSLIQNLDVSPSAWNGQTDVKQSFDMYATGEEGSLYYLFNNIPSPSPTSERIRSHFHRETMLDFLDSEYQLPGLKTSLYPYQRRSAAQMFQRECEEKLELDPRLEKRIALDGSTYYYEPWDVSFFRSPRFYESCKGGILAETMGLGKTLICLTLILATRGHLPRTPAQYDRVVVRPKVASLMDMAISAVNRHSAPWPSFFERHEDFTGEHMGHCIDLMRQNAPFYEIPIEPIRWNRKTTVPAPKKVTLAATTLVVVPRNLLSQWKSELEKHTTGILKTLVMDDNRVALPSPETLATFDLILFSRPRFEYEDRDGADASGRRMSRYPPSCTCPYIGATRTRDCVCIRPDVSEFNSFLTNVLADQNLIIGPVCLTAQDPPLPQNHHRRGPWHGHREHQDCDCSK